VKRLLALRRDQDPHQSAAADWRQNPYPKRCGIVRHIQQQRSNEPIRQVIPQVHVLALDVYLAILICCAAGRYAGSGFYGKVDGLHKERPFLYVMVAYNRKLPCCLYVVVSSSIDPSTNL
jgi:hypothetical protein